MKRGLLSIISICYIFLINFVSAQFYSSYGYGGFSITNFFNRFGYENVIYLFLFLIFFSFLYIILTKLSLFKDAYENPNKAIASVISFSITGLIIYGIHRSDYRVENLFFRIGFSSDLLYTILPLLLLGIAVLLIWKLKFHGFLMIFGLLLIGIASFTEMFYEKGVVLSIGIAMILLGLFIWWWKRKKRRYDWEREKKRRRTKEKKVRDKYTRRYGKRAARKRFG